MGKIITGLFLGFLIGLGCRYFDIPLPSPPRFIRALVMLSLTLGYLGMEYFLARHTGKTAGIARPVMTAQYCGGPTGLLPSREQKVLSSENAPLQRNGKGEAGEEWPQSKRQASK